MTPAGRYFNTRAAPAQIESSQTLSSGYNTVYSYSLMIPMTQPSHVPRKGRGALSNPEGRFETRRREGFDDGWTQADADALPPLETTITPEPAHSIISRDRKSVV